MKYIFFGVIILKCLFLAVPATIVSPFLAAKGSMVNVPACTYAWAFGEYLSLSAIMIVFYLMVSGRIEIDNKRIRAVGACMLVASFDFFDFVIRGNSEWFFVGNYPVTNNVFELPLYWILTVE